MNQRAQKVQESIERREKEIEHEQGLSNVNLDQILFINPMLGKYCLPTCASDTLPRPTTMKRYPIAFITNTKPSNEPGEHWVAFIAWNQDEVEFFDSYGISPAFYTRTFATFLRSFKSVHTNPLTLQSVVTVVCGQWCLFWLYQRLVRKRTVEELTRDLEPLTPVERDQQIAEFVLAHLIEEDPHFTLLAKQKHRHRNVRHSYFLRKHRVVQKTQ